MQKKGLLALIIAIAVVLALVAAGVYTWLHFKSAGNNQQVSEVANAVLTNAEISALPRAERPLKNRVGDPLLPDFKLTKLGGGELEFSENDGKIVVMNFWASWCGPCQNEMPEFEELSKNLDDDVVLMMVNMTDGQRETKAAAEKFVAQSGYSFPVYLDDKLILSRMFNVTGIPMTVIVDKNGYFHDFIMGMTTKAEVEKLVASARAATE